MKNSKELKDIKKAIRNWIKKHNTEVCFVGSFIAFGEDAEVVEDLIIGYGKKGVIKISLAEINKILKGEKEDFINW